MNFYEFIAPDKLNGEQLKQELGAEDVFIRNENLIVVGNFTKEYAENIVKNHIPIPIPEPTIADKLASVGLSLDELKAAILGGN